MADYYPLIARAVAGLPKNTDEARRALYDRARNALVAQLRGRTPTLSESEISNERRLLEVAIRNVEDNVKITPPVRVAAEQTDEASNSPKNEMQDQRLSVASSSSTKKEYSAEFIRNYPILPYAPRYVLGAYALIVVGATVAMLLGAAGMFLGGVGTPGGDLAFGIGAVVGFFGGLIPGFYALTAICPKEPRTLQQQRIGALGAGCFFSLIIMLGVGIAITNSIELKTGHLPLGAKLLLIALTGGFPAALCAVGFMTYQDTKIKDRLAA